MRWLFFSLSLLLVSCVMAAPAFVTAREKNPDAILFSGKRLSELRCAAWLQKSNQAWALLGRQSLGFVSIHLGDEVANHWVLRKKQRHRLIFSRQDSAKTLICPAVLTSDQLSLATKDLPSDVLIPFLAKQAGINVVFNDHLKQVTSLNLTAKTRLGLLKHYVKAIGFELKQVGGIWRVQKKNFTTIQHAKLRWHYWPLHYARAKTVMNLLAQSQKDQSQQFLFSADEASNALLIRADDASFASLKTLLNTLDQAAPQIMISADIVSVDRSDERELGLRFGLNPLHIHGQLGGMALFKVDPAVDLNLELSALASLDEAEVMSSPKIVTANRETASIESGEEIPYQEKTAEGNTSVAFKKAVLSLKVTPEIIPHHKILLHLKLNQDKPSAREVQGVPAIETRQLTTAVLVSEGETVVLGGIYEQEHQNRKERVPFLSRLPALGHLFQDEQKHDVQRELLIFVTPSRVRFDES